MLDPSVIMGACFEFLESGQISLIPHRLTPNDIAIPHHTEVAEPVGKVRVAEVVNLRIEQINLLEKGPKFRLVTFSGSEA